MVGNSNTRWSAGPPCLPATGNVSATVLEPTVPWCGWLWADDEGTPVSLTEAAALRKYVRGLRRSVDEDTDEDDPFLFVETFLPDGPNGANLTGDKYLTLAAGQEWRPSAGGSASTSVMAGGEGHLSLHAAFP